MNSTLKRIAVPLGAAVVLGTSGFAFMASNTVPVTRAGDGNAAITGYEVTNVSYVSDVPRGNIFAVTFDLNGPAKASNVKAEITRRGGAAVYDKCSQKGASNGVTSWECGLNPNSVEAFVVDASNLRVFATQ